MSNFLLNPESKYRKALSSRSIIVHWLILLSISNVTLAAPPQVNILESIRSPPPADKFSVPGNLKKRPRIPRVELETNKESSSATHEKLASTLNSHWKVDQDNKEAVEELQKLWQSKVERTKVYEDFQNLEKRFREARIPGSSSEKEKWINSIEEQLPKIQSLLLKMNYHARGEPFPLKLLAQLFGETNDEGHVQDILLVFRNLFEGTARYEQKEVNFIHKPAFSALKLLLDYSIINHEYLGKIVGKELYTHMAGRFHSNEDSSFSAQIIRGADLVGGLYEQKVTQEISKMKLLDESQLRLLLKAVDFVESKQE